MAHALPRTRFNTSGLVRALAELTATEVAESRQSFAERLGQWLDFKDGLALYSALNAAPAGSAAEADPRAAAVMRQMVARVRAALAESIAADGARGGGSARIALPVPEAGATPDTLPDFAPYQRYYLAHQRDMAANIGPLRAKVRAALSRQSAALARLAGLDAVMEQGLAARERELLATVPGLLARRFERMYAAHRAALGEAAGDDDVQRWMAPGRWLARFCADVQTVLQAELELRLQPLEGLLAAMDHEVTSCK